MSMVETLLGIAILFLVIAYTVDVDDRVRTRADSQAAAALVVDLHESGEAYLKAEYSRLVECFRDAPSSVVAPNPGEAMDYVLSVPLYEVTPSTGVFGDGDVVLGPECSGMRSFQEAGLLPPALGALTYADENGAASEESPWSPAQLVFRYLVRRVNYGNEDYGIQGILVVRSPNGVRLAPDYMRELMVATSLPEIGILDTTSSGADNGLVRGLGGGWQLNVCAQSPGATSARFRCPSTLSASDMRRIDVLSLDHPPDPSDLGKRGEYAVLHAFRDHGSSDDVPMTGGFASGASSARLITIAELTRDTALRNVLYRTDIGIPGANRLQVPIDMGGFGFFNAAYLMGTDSNGDGQVDTGPQILGVPSGNDQTEHPTRVYGDLIVTGSLVVGQAAPPSSASSQPNGLPASGGLIVARNMQLGDPDGPDTAGGDAVLELADVFSDSAVDDPNGALWVQRLQVGQGAAPSAEPFGETGSLASAPASAGRIFAQAVQLGQDDYQDAMHATGTDGYLYARNAQFGHGAVDSGLSAPEADGMIFARNAQLGQQAVDSGVFASTDAGRLYVTAAQVGLGAFDTGLNFDIDPEDADGRIYAQGLQTGLDRYDTFLSGEDNRGLIFGRNAQFGQPEVDEEVSKSSGAGRVYVTALQVGRGRTAGLPDSNQGRQGFDTSLNAERTDSADGRIYARGLQVGQREFDAGLNDSEADGRIFSRGVQVGLPVYDSGMNGTANAGLVFARNAQLGQSAVDPVVSASADAGRLYASAAQLGHAAFDTGLNVAEADGRIYARGAQVGLSVYDSGMNGTANEGLVFARNAQLGQSAVDPGVSASAGAGRFYASAAQLGHAAFDTGLNSAVADGRIYARGAQLGLPTYDSRMGLADGLVFARNAQLGQLAVDPQMNVADGLVFARNAQLGQSAIDAAVFASPDAGRLYASAAQVGRPGFDAGLNLPGSDGRVFIQSLQAGLNVYDPRLNDATGQGAVFARNAQLGRSWFDPRVGGSPSDGRFYATTAQIGGAGLGFDAALADGETLLAGLTRVGNGLRVTGPSVEIRADPDLASEERLSGDVDTESPPVQGLAFYATNRVLSGSPSTTARAVLQFTEDLGDAGSVYVDSLDVESPVGQGSEVTPRMKVDHLLPRVAVVGYQSARVNASVPPDPTCIPPLPLSGSVASGKIAITHGWRTSQVPYEFTIDLALSVQPHGEETVTLGPFRDPYVGWSASDQTGGDDAIGRSGAAEVVSSFFLLCDYT